VEATEGAHKHDAFTVVGILKPTGTPNDRALFINMEGFYMLRGHAKDDEHHDEKHAADADHEHEEHAEHEHADHGKAEQEHGHEEHAEHEHEEHGHEHEEHGHEHAHTPLPESQREVTAILVRSSPTNVMASMNLVRMINKGNEAQAVLPAREIQTLLDMIIGNLRLLLLALSVLIVIVAGIGIMVSIYNSMSDRRREIAVMRSLGARRSTVLNVILLESILLSLGGGAAGWLLGHTVVAAASPWVQAHTGFALGLFEFSPWEAALLPSLVVLASLVGYLPGLAAYRTDVAKALSAAP
ncbi:MAG: lipoprotein ABC transporter permease, partial [Planctomycetia bacterium 21-64-5]